MLFLNELEELLELTKPPEFVQMQEPITTTSKGGMGLWRIGH